MTETILMLSPEAIAGIRTALRVLHFIGLVLGLGAATLLDLVIVRYLVTKTITKDRYQVIKFASHVVTLGLGLLWITGAGFLIHYYFFVPDNLGNPKIWAKIAIVAVLTCNGVFIHRVVLPFLERCIGERLFERASLARILMMAIAAAISVVSWYVPLLLGTVTQLNFVVPATTILCVYCAVLAAAIAVAIGSGYLALYLAGTMTLPKREYQALLERLEKATAG